MSDSKISQLTSLTTPSGSDIFPIVHAASDYAITIANLLTGKTPYIFIASSTASTNEQLIANYICDGTADDVEINAAIAALPSTGGQIILSEGTFNLSATLTVSMEKGFTLRGSGYGTILHINNSANIYAITFTPDSNGVWATFKDFKIECNGQNQTAGGGINATGAVECLFDHIWFNLPYDRSLYLYQIDVSNFGHNNHITNCLFDNGNQSGGNGLAVYIDRNDENMFTNNSFQYNGGAGGLPYHIYDHAGLSGYVNNSFVNGGSAIYLQDTSRTRIVGNVFDRQQASSVYAKGTHIQMVGNNFYQNQNGSDAITFDFYGYNLIVGNTFDASSATGYFVNDDSASNQGNNVIVGNTCLQENGAISGSEPFRLQSPNNIVENNIGTNQTVTKTTTYTATESNRTIFVSAASGWALTLPPANSGVRLFIKKTDNNANAITITRAGSDTIEGATTVALSAQYKSYTLQADGTATWYILAST